MDTTYYGARAANHKLEALWLQEERLSRFLDEDGPISLNAMAVEGNERRQRALAEVDGMFAGLTYLDKLGDAPELTRQYNPTLQKTFDNSDLLQGKGQFSRGAGASFQPDIVNPGLEESEAFCTHESDGDVRTQKRLRQADSTDEIKRAWSGLQSLRKGLEHQHRRLKSIASSASSTNIRKLSEAYGSPKRMGEMGILAYRDVIDFVVPDTLAEVVAFTCVSYVISYLLFQRGRIAHTDILSGLQRWGDCIANIDDRKAFGLFALEMWPLEHLRAMDDAKNGGGKDDDKDLHHSRSNHPTAEKYVSLHPPDIRSTKGLVGEGSSSMNIREASLFNSRELEMLSETLPASMYDQQPSNESAQLDFDVMGILDQSHEEFDFGQFSALFDNQSVTLGGPAKHCDYLPPAPGVDPREMEYYRYHTDPLRDHIPSETFSPMGDPHIIPAPSPTSDKELASVGSEMVKRNIINFECFNRDSDTAIFKLRDTPMFLAVLAFSQDTGDFFYRLSGCGKTVQCTKRGSAYADERSKAERKLRNEVFDPMKKSESANVAFLALLSVAEKFVVLGSLGTLEDVQGYLVGVSREIIEPGQEYEKFVRWIYNFPFPRPSRTESPAKPGTETKRERVLSMTHNESI
ncbi:hypothetical protein ColLi_13239 [Colletotrichum liriopes]|uniref:Uncharacterized protein n=1 Tax=Colletotrichum liriopes TaxID=708192 RepID=A0AA37M0C6_9PEZI|nr:hypothetical protein ColLi_13239 [Colletotrichum liriopes]